MPAPPGVSQPTFTPTAPTDVDPLTVQTSATSPIGIGSVMLNYRMPGSSQWSNAPMTLNAGDVTNGSWSVTIGPLPAGLLSYYVVATDIQNQSTQSTGQLPINMPAPPGVSQPTFTPTAPTDVDPLTVQVSMTSPIGVGSVMFIYRMPGSSQWSNAPMSLNAGDVTNGSWSVTIGPLPAGLLSYDVVAGDNQNQSTQSTGQLTINMPAPPGVSQPTFTPTAPTDVDPLTVQTSVTSAIGVGSVMFIYRMPGSSQWSNAPMTLNAGDVTNGSWSVTLGTLPAGLLSYYVLATDSQGQSTQMPAPIAQLTINTILPVVSSPTFTPSAPTSANPVMVQAGVTSEIGIASVVLCYLPQGAGQWLQATMTLNAGNAANGTWSASIGLLPAGTLTYYLVATDSQGQATTTPFGQLTIGMSTGQTVTTLSFSPVAPTVSDSITVQASITSTIGVASVVFNYQPQGISQWLQATMTLSTGNANNGNWSVTLGPQPAGTLNYYVLVTDLLAQATQTPSPNGKLTITSTTAPPTGIIPTVPWLWAQASFNGVMAYSPSTTQPLLAVAQGFGFFSLLNPDGTGMQTYYSGQGAIQSIAFSPDGKRWPPAV